MSRQSKPWYNRQRRCWMVWWGRQKVRLVDGEQNRAMRKLAEQRLTELRYEALHNPPQESPVQTVASVLEARARPQSAHPQHRRVFVSVLAIVRRISRLASHPRSHDRPSGRLGGRTSELGQRLDQVLFAEAAGSDIARAPRHVRRRGATVSHSCCASLTHCASRR